VLLAACAVLLAILSKLDQQSPPLDTKHEPHDLPEWFSFSEDAPGPLINKRANCTFPDRYETQK